MEDKFNDDIQQTVIGVPGFLRAISRSYRSDGRDPAGPDSGRLAERNSEMVQHQCSVVDWGSVLRGSRSHEWIRRLDKQLVVIYALLNLVEQAVVIVGIVLAIITGTTNIFSTPEYSFGANPWVHLGAHLTIGVAAGTLMPWIIGSIVLAVTRRISPSVRESAVRVGQAG